VLPRTTWDPVASSCSWVRRWQAGQELLRQIIAVRTIDGRLWRAPVGCARFCGAFLIGRASPTSLPYRAVLILAVLPATIACRSCRATFATSL
jgi:hypothetical protein